MARKVVEMNVWGGGGDEGVGCFRGVRVATSRQICVIFLDLEITPPVDSFYVDMSAYRAHPTKIVAE